MPRLFYYIDTVVLQSVEPEGRYKEAKETGKAVKDNL